MISPSRTHVPCFLTKKNNLLPKKRKHVFTKQLWVDLNDGSNTKNGYDFVITKSSFKNNLLPLLLISLDAVDKHDEEIKQDLGLFVLNV
jgi:hypothetical protein